jgi:hypothetical protein
MFTIHNVTRKQIDALGAELQKSDAGVLSEKPGVFDIEGHGITAEAVYDQAAETLTVTVKHKPFFVPEGTIEHGLIEAIGAIPK